MNEKPRLYFIYSSNFLVVVEVIVNFITKSLKGLILSTIAVGLAVIGITALVVVIILNEDIKTFNLVVDDAITHEREAVEITILFKLQVQEWKNVLLRGHNSENLDKYWERFEDKHREIQRKGLALSEYVTDENQRDILDIFLRTHQQLLEKYTLGKDAYMRNGYDTAAGDAVVSGIDREPAKQLQNLIKTYRGIVNEHSTGILDHAASFLFFTKIMIPVMCLLLFGCICLVIKYYFSQPLNALMKSVTYFGESDFSVPIDVSHNNELGIIARQLDTAQSSLRELFTTVKSTAEDVNDNALKIKSNSSLINQGMESTNSRIEQSATAVTEMASTVQEVSRSASHAAESASRADDSAHNGASLMDETIKTIGALADEVSNTSGVIAKLEDETKSIGTVLDVIRGIAEQTNLLALNAAIEAARAGEQGRGFAVVADEVRSLAQRTQESTAEIQQIIETVQGSAKDAVVAMEHGTEATKMCVDQANAAGKSLKEITSTVNDIHMMNTQIATASEEQTTVSEDISQNINGISSFTSEIHRSVGEFEDLSQSLVDLVNKLGEATSVIRV